MQGNAKGLPIDTDVTLASNSDSLAPSVKAIRAYLAAGGAGGAVIGPAVAVDNELVRFDGVSGKVIQACPVPVTLSDTGIPTVTAYNALPGIALFDVSGQVLSGGKNGNPQGNSTAQLATPVQDYTNARLYAKFGPVGAGLNPYGWYPIHGPFQAAPGQPVPWYCTLSGAQSIANTALRTNGYGYFQPGIQDAVDALSTTQTTSAERYVSGKRYADINTSAASGNSSFVTTNTTNPRKILDDDIDLWCDIRTDPTSVASIRYWFGISSATLTDTDTLGSASNGSICIRFSTAAGDAGWVGTTQLNGGANQTVTAQLAAIAAATTYRLRVRFVRTGTPTAYFSVNDGTEIAVTTNIPLTGSTYFMVCGVTTKTAAVKGISIRSFGGSIGS